MPRQTRRNKTQAKEDPPSDFEMEENESIASENEEETMDQDENAKVEEEVASDADDQNEDEDADASESDEEAPPPKKAPKKKRGRKSASASDEAAKPKTKTRARSKPKKSKEESVESSASEPKSKPKSRRDLWIEESHESIMPRLSVNRSIEVKIDKKWRRGWIKAIDAEGQRVHVTYVETELVTGEDGKPRKKTTKADKIVRISSKTIRHTSRRESVGTVSLDSLVGSYS